MSDLEPPDDPTIDRINEAFRFVLQIKVNKMYVSGIPVDLTETRCLKISGVAAPEFNVKANQGCLNFQAVTGIGGRVNFTMVFVQIDSISVYDNPADGKCALIVHVARANVNKALDHNGLDIYEASQARIQRYGLPAHANQSFLFLLSDRRHAAVFTEPGVAQAVSLDSRQLFNFVRTRVSDKRKHDLQVRGRRRNMEVPFFGSMSRDDFHHYLSEQGLVYGPSGQLESIPIPAANGLYDHPAPQAPARVHVANNVPAVAPVQVIANDQVPHASQPQPQAVRAPTFVHRGNVVQVQAQPTHAQSRVVQVQSRSNIGHNQPIRQHTVVHSNQKYAVMLPSQVPSVTGRAVPVDSGLTVGELLVGRKSRSSYPLIQSLDTSGTAPPPHPQSLHQKKVANYKEQLKNIPPSTSHSNSKAVATAVAAAAACGITPQLQTQNRVALVPRSVRRDQKRTKCVDMLTLTDDEDEQKDSNGDSNSCPPGEKRQRKSDLLVYPKEDRDRITIHFEDMRGLNYNELLNDTMTDFYLRYIKNEVAKEEIRDSIHVMSCFFYKKLTERLHNKHFQKSQRSAATRYKIIEQNYQNMRTWTKKVNLFEKDYIVIPIVDDMHWYMLVIVRPRLAVNSNTVNIENNEETRKRGSFRQNPDTYLIVFDSLRCEEDLKRKCAIDIIRDYLELEFEDKKPMEGHFERTRIGYAVPSHLPQQENYVDCGLYLLKYAEHLFSQPPQHDELASLNWKAKYPNFILSLLYSRDLIRKQIQQLCTREKWAEYLEFDASQVPADDVEKAALEKRLVDERIDRARRPRRHSLIGSRDSQRLIRPTSFYGNKIRLRRSKSLPATLEFVDKNHPEVLEHDYNMETES